MHNVSIETSQNVLVNYNIASIGDRIVAIILDTLVMLAIIIILMILLAAMGIEEVWPYILVFSLPSIFYHFLFELLMDGQSLGKRARKIKVTKLDGTQASIGSYILRAIFRPIDSFYGLGLLVIVLNSRGQRIGDIAAKTTVISLKQKISFSDTLLVQIPEDYQPVYPQVVNLTDEQASLIKEVIQNNKADNRHIAISMLAKRVANKLELQHDLRPYEFLDTILKDYNYYTSQ